MAVTMKRTADLLPQVLPYAPTCPDFIAEQAIRMAAIEFAERSRAWRHIGAARITHRAFGEVLLDGMMGDSMFHLLFVSGGTEYRAVADMGIGDPISGPTPAVIHEIEFAEFDGVRLTPVQFSTVSDTEEGTPRYITQIAPNVVTVLPFAKGMIRLSLFLKPSAETLYGTDPANPLFDSLNVVPDFFITLHGQTLALGALARILSIPGEPWTDEQKAVFYKAEFEAKLSGAFRQNMRGQQRAPIRTQYRDF